MPNTAVWTLRETLIVAVLGAVFGVLYLGWVQVWLILQAIFGAVTMDVVMGFWFIVSIIAAAIIRKPGVALVSEVMAAAVQILLGSPAGLMLLLTGLVQGAGAEAVFAATRYRRWSLPVLSLALGAPGGVRLCGETQGDGAQLTRVSAPSKPRKGWGSNTVCACLRR